MNISELIKKLQGVKDKDVKEAFNEAIEGATKGDGKDFEAFILVTDKQTAVCGTGVEMLTLLAMVISDLAEEGLPKEEILKAVDLAYMSNGELKKMADKKVEGNKEQLEKMKEFIEALKEEIK
jgi:hypothetical protein